jgi:hypothetical protein
MGIIITNPRLSAAAIAARDAAIRRDNTPEQIFLRLIRGRRAPAEPGFVGTFFPELIQEPTERATLSTVDAAPEFSDSAPRVKFRNRRPWCPR